MNWQLSRWNFTAPIYTRERFANHRLGLGDRRRMDANAKHTEHAVQIRRMHAAFFEQFQARHHIGGRSLGDHGAVADQHDAIAVAEFLGLMLDHDEAQALLAKLSNECEDFRLALRVEVGGRLVEQNHARSEREHRGNREPLFLAAGERSWIAIFEACQPDSFERRLDACRDLLVRHRDLFHRKRDFVRHVGREQLRFEILEDHSDRRGNVAYASAVENAAAASDDAVELAILEGWNDAVEAFSER